jgi:hypothetical protein
MAINLLEKGFQNAKGKRFPKTISPLGEKEKERKDEQTKNFITSF